MFQQFFIIPPQHFSQSCDYLGMRPIRDTNPNKVHLLTCRTRLSELLFVPNNKINNCLGGIIAKYAQFYNIELYSAVIPSNHYHMLLRGENVSLFAENINREIAKRVNIILGRKGSLWGRRYDDQITIEETDELEGLLYILTNPVKHGLVTHSKHWPGLSTYSQVLGAKAQFFTFLNYTEFKKAQLKAKATGEVVHRSDYETRFELKLSPLRLYRDLSDNDRIKTLNYLLEKRIKKLCEERREQGRGFLGRKTILSQSTAGEFPIETNKTIRPVCYTKCLIALKEFKEELKLKIAQYREASIKYRQGMLDAIFPPHCFYPPRHHKPKNYYFVHT